MSTKYETWRAIRGLADIAWIALKLADWKAESFLVNQRQHQEQDYRVYDVSFQVAASQNTDMLWNYADRVFPSPTDEEKAAGQSQRRKHGFSA